MKNRTAKWLTFVALSLASAVAGAEDFTYSPPGELVGGSGRGRVDNNVYVPDMRFPIEAAPAYPNSQVWGVGGSQGPSGGQCDERNYSYPWYDNYCESRSWDMPLCPSGTGHQGQDIRPSTCANKTHWTVAAESGRISNIGTYSVYLVTDSGTQHRYLHMDPGTLRVREGQRVNKGDRLGLVSNAFGGTPTTIHLHYDLKQSVSGVGFVYVPTYMSLVRSYETLIGQEAEPCAVIPGDGGVVDDYGPCFTAFGPPRYWREVDGSGVEGKFHWTNAFVNASPSNWARWRMHFKEAGQYRVEANVVEGFNKAKKVKYRIKHMGGESTVTIDQSATNGWADLGVYRFDAEGAFTVDVLDNTGESGSDLHITADAIRVTPAVGGGPSEPSEDPNDPGTEPEDPSDPRDPSDPTDPALDPRIDGGNNDKDTDSPPSFKAPKRTGVAQTSSEAGCAVSGTGAPSSSTGLLFLALAGIVAALRRRTR